VHAPAQLADGLARAEQALGRDAPSASTTLGWSTASFAARKGAHAASSSASGFRFPWPTQDGVGDVDLVAGELDFAASSILVRSCPARPTKGRPARLVGARTLADHDQLRARVARAEHDRRAPSHSLHLRQPGARLLGAERLGGPSR